MVGSASIVLNALVGWGDRGSSSVVRGVVVLGCAAALCAAAAGAIGDTDGSPSFAAGVSDASPEAAPPQSQQIVLSFTGDNILGTDDNFSAASSLPTAWAEHANDPLYFFRNVAGLFAADDLTVANFEVALTNSREKRYKGEGEVYHFHGDPALATTLPAGGIDAVTVANNHTFDYGQHGFDDTVAALRANGIGVFGTGSESEGSSYDLRLLRTLKGVTFGFVGYQAWTDSDDMVATIRRDLAALRAVGAGVVIPFFHWGIESEHLPYEVQRRLAQIAVDSGADLVVGTHPHVIQSMEIYRGKLIAYSFGNFSFGGNSNPSDKRTFILQTRLNTLGTAVRSVDFRVIPTRVSGNESYNDYVPTPYIGPEKDQVLGFINEISPTLGGRAVDGFVPVVP